MVEMYSYLIQKKAERGREKQDCGNIWLSYYYQGDYYNEQLYKIMYAFGSIIVVLAVETKRKPF